MKKLLRIIQVLYCIYALFWFVALMFIVLVFALFFALFGKIKGGNLVYYTCKWWARTWYFLVGIWHREIYEAPHNKKRQFIFVANHISYMDIPCIIRSIHQPVRILGKYEMVKYPIFGTIYRMVVVLVDRSSPEKRAKSVRGLKAALHRGISIFIFPEGTFNETGKPLKDFYDGAFRVAIETQTPIKPILFIDTHERMHYRNIWQLTPGKCRCVYLAEVPVNGYTMKDLPRFKEEVYSRMEAGLLRWGRQ
ncbi:MAG TPA: 1-acyl-sn-glycerol-3-phosphate acyltransferase [Chitinophagaceae bacterium]|nr:1-acyl-sn-glycerol-3-phosphate acyltransferase [Chitinophagaceae bacterium]